MFNFLEHPNLTVLSEGLKSLPGIERIDVLFFNPESAKTELYTVQRNEHDNKPVALDITKEQADILNTFRRKQTAQNWLKIEDIPYSKPKNLLVQPDLFSEFDSHVLSLAFANTTDFSKDIFLYYFRKNTSDFGPSKASSLLSTSNKTIIAQLLYHGVYTQLQTIKTNQENLLLLNEYNQRLLYAHTELNKKNKQLKAQNATNLLQLTEFLINDLTTNDKEVYYLSEQAKKEIGQFAGSIFELKNQLEKALILAKTLNFGKQQSEYRIEANYFNFSSNEVGKQAKQLSEPLQNTNDNRHQHSKTFDFLDELEESAQKLLKEGWKLTSANVGYKFEKPVTAAAISDKLKHHSSKIVLLLNQYPSRWPLIRKRFKPLQNVLVKAVDNKFSQTA